MHVGKIFMLGNARNAWMKLFSFFVIVLVKHGAKLVLTPVLCAGYGIDIF